VSKGTEKSNEFRRYRQALAVVYITTIAGGFALLAASVAVQLFLPPDVELEGPVLSQENPDPAMLLACNQSVQKLYDELGEVTADLMAAPGRDQSRELGREWEAFGRKWIHDWHVVNATCRFEDLSGSMGEPYDRMAEVHGDLRAMRLKYQSLLVRFDEEQAAELRRMQRALDQSRRALEDLAEEAGGSAGDERPQ
jgi:hypothetical protein